MRVFELFCSINGEPNLYHQGSVCTFVRFAGCNLDCTYCDTKQARGINGGREWSVGQIMIELVRNENQIVMLTGGEPLLQEDFNKLLQELLKHDFKVIVETNGSVQPWLPERNCSYVMDYKLPSSGMDGRMDLNHFQNLGYMDFIKFVIGTMEDFNEANRVRKEMPKEANFIYSAMLPSLEPKTLGKWLVQARIHGILGVQLHKIIDMK